MKICRGTTPTITVKLPPDIKVSEVQSSYILIDQAGSNLITKTGDDVTADSAKNTLSVKLSQEDTFTLSAKMDARIQVRLLINDTALASQIIYVDIDDVIGGGIIE